MESNQHQYAQRLRLLQIRIKKLQDRLEQAKYGRYLKQAENDRQAPPPAHQVPYLKFAKTYYPDTGYKRNTDLINNMKNMAQILEDMKGKRSSLPYLHMDLLQNNNTKTQNLQRRQQNLKKQKLSWI